MMMMITRWWWYASVIPAFGKGKQSQVDLREFEASLGYKMSSRTARTVTQRNPVSKKKKQKKKKKR